MKKIVRLRTYILFALLGLSTYSLAQTSIMHAEYFFDTDPGVGKGTALTITPNDSINLNKSITLSGLSIGPHEIFIRFQNSGNSWSLSESRWFNVVATPTFPSYQITGGEYFFDTDPGVGKGTPIVTGTLDSVSINPSIPITSLPVGPHNLFCRFKNSNGTWGDFDTKSFVVMSISNSTSAKLNYGEYFIDSDPGMGKATPITFVKTDSLKSNFAINLGTGLTNGVHNITIRLRDSIGKWTLAESRFFNVLPAPEKTAPLASLEFFYDKDPGVGNGFVLQSLGNKDSININAQALVNSSLTSGSHIIMIRAKDSIGRYSMVNAKQFYICSVFPVANFTATYVSFDSTVSFTSQTTGADANTQYYWDFNGDGANDNSFQNPDYKYTNPGVYNVRLITTNGGVCGDTIIKKVIATNDTCHLTSAFIFQPKVTSNEVDFQDQSSGSIGSYYWDFGDGFTSTQKNPIHIYKLAGNYQVSLAIKNGSNSCTDFSSKVITVGTSGCQASFTDIVDTTKAAFTNNSLGGSDLRYFWFFGDGSYSLDENPSHVFANNAEYNVSLTISKADGTCSSQTNKYIQIGQVKCNASFTYFVDSTSNLVYFSDQIVGPSTNLFWSFGDGKNSVQNNPTHAYAHPGYYTVGLNTFNANNYCMDYYEQTILVGNANNDCVADFIYQADTTSGKVNFYDASKGDIIGYIWNFGDSYELAQKNPQYTYAPAGYKNVCLTVVNSNAITSFKCKPVYSGPNPIRNCKADFTYTIDSASNHGYFNDLSVGLSPTSSDNTWNWDLGNGIKATTQNGDITYGSSGYYIVSLRVSNSITGCSSKAIKIVGIGNTNRPIKAGYGYDVKTSGTKADGYPVDFTGAGVGDHARLRWDFGDSTSSSNSDTTTLTPTHYFTLPGTYNVCLTIENQLTGDSDVYCENVSTKVSCTNDITPPTVYCKNIIIGLNAAGQANITPQMVDSLSYDNCSSTIKLSLDKTTFTQANLGNNTVKLTVTDSSNNVSYCNANVLVTKGTFIAQTVIQDFNIWPNPTTDNTNIRYVLSKSSSIEISVVDLQGKVVDNILQANRNAGEYTFVWNSSNIAKGTYIITFKGNDGVIGRKMLIKQ